MNRILDEPPRRRRPAYPGSRWSTWARALATRHGRVAGRFPRPTMALATLPWPARAWRPGGGAGAGSAVRSVPAATAAAAGLAVRAVPGTTAALAGLARAARPGAGERAPRATAAPIGPPGRLPVHPWGPVARPARAHPGTAPEGPWGLWTAGSPALRRRLPAAAGGPVVGRLWRIGVSPARRGLPPQAGGPEVGGWRSGMAGGHGTPGTRRQGAGLAGGQAMVGRLAGRWQRVELRAGQVAAPASGLGQGPGAALGPLSGRLASQVLAARPRSAAPAHGGHGQDRAGPQEQPEQGWAGPSWPGRAGAPAGPADLELLAEQVVRQIDRRIVAHRERLGRI